MSNAYINPAKGLADFTLQVMINILYDELKDLEAKIKTCSKCYALNAVNQSGEDINLKFHCDSHNKAVYQWTRDKDLTFFYHTSNKIKDKWETLIEEKGLKIQMISEVDQCE